MLKDNICNRGVKMRNELISVIVPIYNVEKYLHRCVDSILGQTYHNLEIILIDDGSPDNCSIICDEYAQKDYRIRVVHKTNGGLSDARNVGIEAATGEYLMFVDSDDFIAANMIEKLYHALLVNNADISICNFKYVDENGASILFNPRFSNSKLPIQDGVISGTDILKEKLFATKCWYWVVAWNKLYKKSIFSEIRYPVGKIHEDEFVIHAILMKCDKVACVSEMLYYYVQRSDSIMGMSKTDSRKIDYTEALLLRAKGYLLNNEMGNLVDDILLIAISSYQRFLLAGNHLDKYKNREIQHLYREVYLTAKCKRGQHSFKKRRKLFENYISMYLNWREMQLINSFAMILQKKGKFEIKR